MKVSLATKDDLPAIRKLLKEELKTQPWEIGPEHLTRKDVALVAYEPDSGEIAAFGWAGVMAGGTMAYVGYFTIGRRFRGHGVGRQLGDTFKMYLKRRGIKHVFGIVKHDEFYFPVLANAKKLGAFRAAAAPYTYIYLEEKHG